MTTACDSTDLCLSAYTVALAYLMQKVPYVFPIVGGRKVEHLHDNINSLEVALKPEHFKKIEAATPFDPGFPTNMMVRLLAVLRQAAFLTPGCLPPGRRFRVQCSLDECNSLRCMADARRNSPSGLMYRRG